jgi:maleylacetoacetate isomerase
MTDVKLFTYWRSSAAYRVRIALNLKKVDAQQIPIHLVKDGGEQHSEAYRAINPNGLVPALVHDGVTISNSLAIIEYLDEVYPDPALLPGDAAARARVRQISQAIACDIHPLQNLRVLQYVTQGQEDPSPAMFAWARHWIEVGFAGLETQLSQEAATGQFCHGDQVTMADLCLVPQMANARRFEVDLSAYPTLSRIDATASVLPAFAAAAPANQPDAQ